jgi:hypothetical protein
LGWGCSRYRPGVLHADPGARGEALPLRLLRPLPPFAHKHGNLLGGGWSDVLAREGEEVKPYPLLAILGLALGVASPLPIWPGPLFIRHLPPGLVSFALIVAACLGSMREGSKVVGGIAIFYGAMPALAGLAAVLLAASAASAEVVALRGVLIAGGAFLLAVGLTAISLGCKTFRRAKR